MINIDNTAKHSTKPVKDTKNVIFLCNIQESEME